MTTSRTLAPAPLAPAPAANALYHARASSSDPSHSPGDQPASHLDASTQVGPKGLRCVSCNVQRSQANTTILLERFCDADIICVQESFWGLIRYIPSPTSTEGDPYYNTVTHPHFICLGASRTARVSTYVHKRWAHASPRIRRAQLDHPDFSCISLQLDSGEFNFLNIYNDSRTHNAVQFLLDRSVQLPAIAFMAGDFNLRHRMWDRREAPPHSSTRNHHRKDCDDLIQLASMELGLHLLNDPDGPPTWVSNNRALRPGVLDLVWADPSFGSYDPLLVHLHDRTMSDHAILEWHMPLDPSPDNSPCIGRESKAAKNFIDDIGRQLSSLPTAYSTRDEVVAQADTIQSILQDAWAAHAVIPRTCRKSKTWWNPACSQAARDQRAHRQDAAAKRRARRQALAAPAPDEELARELKDAILQADQAASRAGHQLKTVARHARRDHFNALIADTDPKRVWDLVNWTKPRKLDATTTILKPDGSPTNGQQDLRDTFQAQFTPPNPRPVDISMVSEIPQLPERSFSPITEKEFRDCLRDTSNRSAPGPDHLTWFWIKQLVKRHPDAVTVLLALFNACVTFGVHPQLFKESVTVVIPKPNKPDYSRAKAYRPIVLLNCIGKLLEKIIAKRMQFDGQQAGVLHPCQFGGTMQHSTTDAGIQLVHNIRQAWGQGLSTSALLLDVSQFFPSINHTMLTAILRRQGFNHALCDFFTEYLVGRITTFRYNGTDFTPCDFNVGLGQGSALSPILSGLYIAPALHACAPVAQSPSANASLQFFVDDGLISVAAPLLAPNAPLFGQLCVNNAILAHLFTSLMSYMSRLGLGIEHDKLELMHFVKPRTPAASESHPLGPDIVICADNEQARVRPKSIMRYLGFFLDPSLSFRHHVKTYTAKACSTVQAYRMLGNSVRGMSPPDRRRLYISNILPIALYGAQLWWHPSWKRTKWIAQELQKIQSRAGRWITGCFRTTPAGSLDILARLIPIRHQVNKHMRDAALRIRTLPESHPLRASMPPYWRTNALNIVGPLPLNPMPKAPLHASPLQHVDWIGRQCNEDFDTLNVECRPGDRLLDIFAGRISFDLEAPKKEHNSDEFRTWKLNSFEPKLQSIMSDPTATSLFTDGSHKEDDDAHLSGAAWAVYHKHSRVSHGSFGFGKASSFDAEMAALARGLRAAIENCPDYTQHLHIFVDNQAAINSIFAAAKGPSQMLSIMACRTARAFFAGRDERTIQFHWCPSHVLIEPNEFVDKLAKQALFLPQPDFVSYSTAKAASKTAAVAAWKRSARSKKYRGRSSLFSDDPERICITNAKKSLFVGEHCKNPKLFARFSRFMTGHFPHGAFRKRFHLPGPTACQCGHRIETATHILFDCPLWVRYKHMLRPNVPRHPPNPNDPLDDRDPDNYDTRIHDPEFIPAEFFTEPRLILLFLRLNPMVASFDWCELLAKARSETAAHSTPPLHAAQVWMHTQGKLQAINGLNVRDIWFDDDALTLFSDTWNVANEAFDACEKGWLPESVGLVFLGDEGVDV